MQRSRNQWSPNTLEMFVSGLIEIRIVKILSIQLEIVLGQGMWKVDL